MLKFLSPVNFGKISLCFVFSIALSNCSNIAGRTVITQISPNKTPFAITIPMSFPNVKFMLHKAKNPAIVVSELPTTEVAVWQIAFAIACSLFAFFSFSAL